MRSIICGIFLAAVSFAMLVMFIVMWVQDSVYVVEPILWVRALETAMAMGFGAYGTYFAIHTTIEKARKDRDKRSN